MLQSDALNWRGAEPVVAIQSAAGAALRMLAYRSRAATLPTERDLQDILRLAQQRNRTEGVTGLLIYDQGSFFQWLEGPAAGIARIWESITRDTRHRDIEILREQPLTKRFFGDWDMRLAHRARGADIDAALVAVKAPHELLKRLRFEQSVLARSAWGELFAEVVIPRLQTKHEAGLPVAPGADPGAQRSPTIWHADRGAAAKLATLVLAVDAGAVPAYLNAMVAQGATLEALFREVFEPAARHLGGLWDEDRCLEVEVTVGLGRLQIEAHRLGAAADQQIYAIKPGHTVLIAPQPGEPHGLGAIMASELFERSGWDVSCEFPATDAALRELVHDRWFDVLDLSLSGAMRRGHRLQSMGESIVAARASSLNPALVVIVDGRAFFEQPKTYLDVHAHAGCVTVIEAVPAAQQLIDALAAVNVHKIRKWQTDPAQGNARSSESAAASLRLFEKRFRSTVF